MDITKALNEVIDYIEENIEGEISIEKAASIACCSVYHFTRMFSYLADVSFSEYIRYRKLTQATDDLQHSTNKIIDISNKYGYESPSSFSRAFQAFHGISPKEARKKGVTLKSILPISFQISIKGAEVMKYRIEERAGFKAIGIKRTFSTIDGQNFKGIPIMWQEVFSNGSFDKIMKLNNCTPNGSLGVCANMVGTDFDYYIAVASTLDTPDDMVDIIIEQRNYAVFPCKIKEIQTVTRRIFSQWLPNSQYDHDDDPEVELYFNETDCEILIPVSKSS